ncbi:MAG: rhomboid family intramembrane serine protease [Phycisphaerales bacterium]|nr:rhomboid family intramembrane serine protease [Phycisphaerales bacterium]
MGVSDRDYARVNENRWGGAPPGSQAAGGRPRRFDPRSWSMTGWLVFVNVAVWIAGIGMFFIPGDRGWVAVPVDIVWEPGVAESVKARALEVDVSKQQKIVAGAPIIVRTGQRVGTQRYTPMTLDQAWGHFSTAKAFGQLEVWRFVTFQFLHSGWTHLILNMIGLWTFGPDVEDYLGRKRYLALYLACGVFGAVSYLLLNLVGNLLPSVHIPGLLFQDVRTPLVGASAGIFGIMLAAAFVVPQRVIDLLFVIPIRVKPAVYLFFGISVINLIFGARNAGGEAAHVGGAVAGYYFIRNMYLLRDFFDVFGASRKPGAARVNQAEIDRILAKIHQHGEPALDDEERETLRRATEAANGFARRAPRAGERGRTE